MLSLITEHSALGRISFLFLNHLMASGGVPETRRVNLTFDPGKTFLESGFSRMRGGSVDGKTPKCYHTTQVCKKTMKKY